MRGVVAAGHPVTAEAGADALRAGGNAVDAALAAMLTSFVAEPMLTGLGAGGYMLVAPPGEEPVLLDFFVEAPGRGRAPGAPHAPLLAVDVDFGDAVQVFNIGAAAAGPYGTVAGVAAAAERFGRMSLGELSAPAAETARRGVVVNVQQAYLFEILSPITSATAEARAHFMPAGRSPRVGDVHRDPALADALERLGAEGPAPFYTGDLAAAVCAWVAERGGLLTAADLAAYDAVARAPVQVAYRGADRRHEPATERRRDPPRARARAARPRAVSAHGERGLRRDGARAGGAHAGVPRRASGARLPRAVHREPARRDDAHLGGRRRRLGLRGDVHERRGMRRGGARHRHPPEQHDG